VIYVPAPFVLDSIIEAVDSGVGLIVVITQRLCQIDIFIFSISAINRQPE
jgi:succinyl-CoA synthetase alpha subunit